MTALLLTYLGFFTGIQPLASAPMSVLLEDVPKEGVTTVIACWDGQVFKDGAQCFASLDSLEGDEAVPSFAVIATNAASLSGKGLKWKLANGSLEVSDEEDCYDENGRKVRLQSKGIFREVHPEMKVKKQPLKNKRYRKIVAQALKVKTVRLLSLFRVDLEGDGVEEVLFRATYKAKGTVREAVGYRKVLGKGNVVTKVIKDSEGGGDSGGTYFAGVSDLNGDGFLEVLVTSSAGDNGMGNHSMAQFNFSLWQLTGEPKRLAGASCMERTRWD